MIINATSVLCKHANERIGVLVAYSNRAYEEHPDAGATDRIQRLFDSIEFSVVEPTSVIHAP